MNPRGYFQLLRIRIVLLHVFVGAVLASVSAAGLRSRPMDSAAFVWIILLIPLLVYGSLLAAAAQEAFHTTYGPVLPGLRQIVRRWFTLASIAAALGWAIVVHYLWPEIRVFPAWMLSWLFACVLLPSESRLSRRSLAIRVAAILMIGAVALRPRLLFASAVAHPGSIGVVAGCGAGCCIWLGFGRERLRRRGLTPWISPFSDLGDRDLEKRIPSLAQPLAFWRKSARQWPETWLGYRLRAWARAASYENGTFRLLAVVSFIPLLNLVLDLLAVAPKPGLRAEFIYQMLSDPASYHGTFSPSYRLLMAFVALGLGIGATSGLKNDRLYPLSRRDRASVCFRSILTFEAGLVLGWGLIQFALIFVARSLAPMPRPMPPIPWFAIELGLVLSLLPIVQWLKFIPSRVGCLGALLIALVLMPALVGWICVYCAASVYRLPGLSAGLVICVVLPAAAHGLAWLLLKHAYARRDLITVPQHAPLFS
jgi:hypothetical protein